MREAIIAAVISAVVSGLIGTVVFGGIKSAMERRLKAADEKEKMYDDFHKRRRIIEQRRWQALGRFMFWVTDAFENGGTPHDGDIRKAHEAYSSAENDDKELDREIIATMEGGQT